MKLIKRCQGCGEYTLSNHCTHCGSPTYCPDPGKFSPHDKYAKYRLASNSTHA